MGEGGEVGFRGVGFRGMMHSPPIALSLGPEPCCLPHSALPRTFVLPSLPPLPVSHPSSPPLRWIDEDTLLPEATKHADSIIKAGMQQLPNNPFMIILYSSFLIDVQGSYQSGYAQLQTAKKADPR